MEPEGAGSTVRGQHNNGDDPPTLLQEDATINTSIESTDIPDSLKCTVRAAEATLEKTTANAFWKESPHRPTDGAADSFQENGDLENTDLAANPTGAQLDAGEDGENIVADENDKRTSQSELNPDPPSIDDSIKPKQSVSPTELSLQPTTRPSSPPTTHPIEYSPRRQSSSSTANITQTKHNATKQATERQDESLKEPKELPSTSRLLQPTISSAGSPRNNLDRRHGTHQDLDAARKLAKERIRERKMKEQETDDDNQSTTSSRQIKMSPEEGRARARARVKIRQLQEDGKDNDTSIIAQKLQAEGRKKGTHTLTVPQGPKPSQSSKRSITVPKAPNFATSKRASVRSAASAMGSRAVDADDSTSLASRSVASNTYSLGASTLSSRATNRTSRSVTVPRGPNFVLDAKYGVKKKTPQRVNNDERSMSSTSTSMGTKRSITVPQAPKFALDERYGIKKTVPLTAKDESPNSSFEHGLRSDDNSISTWHSGRITVPVAPKFHKTSQRAKPKSSEEIELEEMEKYQKRLKPRPVPKTMYEQSKAANLQPRSTRKLTVPVAPKFHETHKRNKVKSSEELESEYIDSHQKVRQKPSSSAASVASDTSKLSRVSKRSLTVPVAPRFHTSSKRAVPKSSAEIEEEEMKKQFKARSVPAYMKSPEASRSKASNRQTGKENNEKAPSFSKAYGRSTTTQAKPTREPLSLTAGKSKTPAESISAREPLSLTAGKSQTPASSNFVFPIDLQSSQLSDATQTGFKARPLPKSTHLHDYSITDTPASPSIKLNLKDPPLLPSPSGEPQDLHHQEARGDEAERLAEETTRIAGRQVSFDNYSQEDQRPAGNPEPLADSSVSGRATDVIWSAPASAADSQPIFGAPLSPVYPATEAEIAYTGSFDVATQTEPETGFSVVHNSYDSTLMLGSESVSRVLVVIQKDKGNQAKDESTQAEQVEKSRSRPASERAYHSIPIGTSQRKSPPRRAAGGDFEVPLNTEKIRRYHNPVPATTYRHSMITPRDKEALSRAEEIGKKRTRSLPASEKDQTFYKARPVPKTTYDYKPTVGETSKSVGRSPPKTPTRLAPALFRARPIPKSTYEYKQISSPRSAPAKRKLAETKQPEPKSVPEFPARNEAKAANTTPDVSSPITPRTLSLERGEAMDSNDHSSPQDAFVFKARPVPKSTYHASLSPRETRKSPRSSGESQQSFSFKARPMPSYANKVSPRETALSKARMSIAVKTDIPATEGEASHIFTARPVPKSTHEQRLSPRETVKSRQMAAIMKTKPAIPSNKESVMFHARPIPKSLESAILPKQTRTSIERSKTSKTLDKSSDERTEIKVTPPVFRARRIPKSEGCILPKQTLTSMKRVRKAQSEVLDRSKKLLTASPNEAPNSNPIFKALPAPKFNSCKSTSPKGTKTSNARLKQAEERAARESRAHSTPVSRATPIPRSTPRATLTSQSREMTAHAVASVEASGEESFSFKARPVPETTYKYSPISSFEKAYTNAIASREEERTNGDDGKTIELHQSHVESITTGVSHGMEEEHTIEFSGDHEEDELSVGQLLSSVNSPAS